MKIGFDAKKAVKNRTGIGNYSRRCINAIAANDAKAELYLFAPRRAKGDLQHELPARISYQLPRIPWLYELWRMLMAPVVSKRLQLDIYHGLSNELPFFLDHAGKCRSVVTIHDLIFLEHPETYGKVQYQILKFKTRYACQHADCIIAISEKTKADIIKWYGVPESRITVLYQSIDGIYFKTASDEQKRQVREKYGITKPYIISVGTIETRKNQLTAVRALAQTQSDVHLYLIGKPTPYQKEVEAEVSALHLTERVHILNNVSNAELPAFYQMASALCFMSIYEGFGLPIAEAAASGIPLIAAKGSCLEEAGGPDAAYFNPFDAASVAAEIDCLLSHPKLAQEKGRRNRTYSGQFKDEYHYQKLMRLYQSLSLKEKK